MSGMVVAGIGPYSVGATGKQGYAGKGTEARSIGVCFGCLVEKIQQQAHQESN